MDKITYTLPKELIAQFPSDQRDGCKLLHLERDSDKLSEYEFGDLTKLLGEGHLLVINDTMVRKARLFGVGSQSGRRCELFLLEKLSDEEWICMARPGKKAKVGNRFYLSAKEYCEVLEVLPDGSRRVNFVGASADDLMDKYGHMPLPPYIRREDIALDKKMYQTVYAREGFSIAAPTAGLHFTEKLLDKLKQKGVEIVNIRLDVGRGTFKPVEAKSYERHKMDAEEYWIDKKAAKAINKARKDGRKIVAVGTTVVRALESSVAKHGEVKAEHDETELFIYPGYEFKIVDQLITNFHLPGSTLLAMVAALSSRDQILQAYEFAIKNGYRFYSYGDAMYIS
ncbi:MAG: tRNA preQ1(34) S-adenosylmethionine ribosyltransferase-isomerase QueA [bacterium]